MSMLGETVGNLHVKYLEIPLSSRKFFFSRMLSPCGKSLKKKKKKINRLEIKNCALYRKSRANQIYIIHHSYFSSFCLHAPKVNYFSNWDLGPYLHHIAWNTICLPNKLGGLGIPSANGVNRAALMR